MGTIHPRHWAHFRSSGFNSRFYLSLHPNLKLNSNLHFCFSLIFLFSFFLMPYAFACENLLLNTITPANFSMFRVDHPVDANLNQVAHKFKKLLARLERDQNPTAYINETLAPARSIEELNNFAYQERLLRAFAITDDFARMHFTLNPAQQKLLTNYVVQFHETYLQALANCFRLLGIPWRIGQISTPAGTVLSLKFKIKEKDILEPHGPYRIDKVTALQAISSLMAKAQNFWRSEGVENGEFTLIYTDLDVPYIKQDQSFAIYDRLGVAGHQNGNIFLPYNVFANQYMAVPFLFHEFTHYQNDGRTILITVDPQQEVEEEVTITPAYPKYFNLSEIHAYAETLAVIHKIKDPQVDTIDAFHRSGLNHFELSSLNHLRQIVPLTNTHLLSAKAILDAMDRDDVLLDRGIDIHINEISESQKALHHADERVEVIVRYPVLTENNKMHYFMLHFPYDLTPANATLLDTLAAPEDTAHDLHLKWKKHLRRILANQLTQYIALCQLFNKSLTSADNAAKFWLDLQKPSEE